MSLHFALKNSRIIVFREKTQDKYITKIARNGIEIFSKLNLSDSVFPNFKFTQKYKKLSGQVLHSGTGNVYTFLVRSRNDLFYRKESLFRKRITNGN